MIRLLILPFWKIDKALPLSGTIMDVGCGAGIMSNYLAICSPARKVLGVDLSKNRIISAKQSISGRKNIKFKLGNITKMTIKKYENYLMVDVLHHIPFQEQQKLLTILSKKLNKSSLLIIKEVDASNRLPFLFGHFWEKVLYPNEQINVRTRKEWLKVFSKLGLGCTVLTGSPIFPDSTLIFVCHKK
ncbi:MAG: class I SAM-dependent methyltransferase [Microgenomates group bacterium]|jgi:2-polyprenyl-3-methyl-5-hydroxy-6-metoxy-1,4-benzoquinol methylase